MKTFVIKRVFSLLKLLMSGCKPALVFMLSPTRHVAFCPFVAEDCPKLFVLFEV